MICLQILYTECMMNKSVFTFQDNAGVFLEQRLLTFHQFSFLQGGQPVIGKITKVIRKSATGVIQ